MRPGVSPCAERISDSPSAAMFTFHDGKHTLNGHEPRSVRRNENQHYPRQNSQKPELNGNLEMPRGPLEERRHTASKILQ
jgi:hypothetical protein